LIRLHARHMLSFALPRMNITSRISIYVALGTLAVMTIVTGTDYQFFNQVAEQCFMEHLDTYVHEVFTITRPAFKDAAS
jgi:hypothetical protein